jgi:hypothetical protein
LLVFQYLLCQLFAKRHRRTQRGKEGWQGKGISDFSFLNDCYMLDFGRPIYWTGRGCQCFETASPINWATKIG